MSHSESISKPKLDNKFWGLGRAEYIFSSKKQKNPPTPQPARLLDT